MRPRIFGSLILAAGTLLGLATTHAHAQEEYYYAGLSPAENAEVVAWNVLYWQRVDDGGGAPGAGFAFTSNAMKSPLFNPVRAARSTLEQVGKINSGLCDRLDDLPTYLDVQTAGARDALRNTMLYGTIETQAGTIEEWKHLLLIDAAPVDYPYLAYDVDGYLISVELPLSEVSEVAGSAALALNIGSESQQIIASLIAAGGNWRSQCTDVPQWQSLITGETSTAEQFRVLVLQYLALRSASAGLSVVRANFGTFGELPIVFVTLPDCFILMDPTTGNLSGPFDPASTLDAQGLLSQHADAYQAGSSLRYYTSTGCPTALPVPCALPPAGTCGVGQTWCSPSNAPNNQACMYTCIGTPPSTSWGSSTSCNNGCKPRPTPPPLGWQPGCTP